jgi:hypothetical protein
MSFAWFRGSMIAVVTGSFGCTDSAEPNGSADGVEDAGHRVDASSAPDDDDLALDAAPTPIADAASRDGEVAVSLRG